MHILCPHCKNPIELVKLTRDEILCPSCGSTFRLAEESTASWKERAGQKLGRFEILDTVGHGAFGTVYKARDPELDRTVAIKVPRAGNLGDGQDVDRFLREARSVAQLRHESIVSIHEVGQQDGLPYLVSDFVEGSTLADVLEARALAHREAAELVAKVADALHYAHEHGVVHRDVKPSNIMLESRDGESGRRGDGANEPSRSPRPPVAPSPRPRLMDFGLAKRDAGEITMTMEGQVLGTPAYLSPELARGEAHQVDGRSDIYSLGVVFYKLLTGELPFRGNKRMLLEQVLHDEPKPPRRLNDRIPRDLETICLKAMAKETSRRFQTAGALADDLRRFLNGEPIHARPVGRVERAWHWCRRNPALAGLSAAVLLLLIAGTAVSTSLAIWAVRGWDQVEQNAREEAEQRQRADQALSDLGQVLFEFANMLRSRESKLKAIDRVQEGIDIYQRLADANPAEPRYQRDLAAAYDHLGMLLEETGQRSKAEEAFQEALRRRQTLAASFPETPESWRDLAITYNNYGILLETSGRLKEGEEFYRRAIELRKKLMADFPSRPEYRQALAASYNNLAIVLKTTDRWTEAEEAYRQALAIQRQLVAEFPKSQEYQSELARSLANFCIGFRRLGRLAEAEAAGREALGLQQRLVAGHPAVHAYRSELARTHNNLALVLDDLGRWDEAESAYRKALATKEQLAKEIPYVPDYREDQAAALNNLAKHLYNHHRDRVEEAESLYRKGLAIRKELAAELPRLPEYRSSLSGSYNQLGVLLKETGRTEEAETMYRQAEVLREQLVREYPNVPDYRMDLGGTYNNLGALFQATNRLAEAKTAYGKAVDIYEKLVRGSPTVVKHHADLARIYCNVGTIVKELGELEPSLKWFGSALATLETPSGGEGMPAGTQKLFRLIHKERAEVLAKLGRHTEAMAIVEELAVLKDLDLSAVYNLACICSLASAAARGDTPLANKYAARAVGFLQQAVKMGFKDIALLRNDKDLDALREREDFKKLLAEVEAGRKEK